MQELINISGQQFYYANIEEVIGRWSQKAKCAVIIDESYLPELLKNGKNVIEESGQIIIISEKVNAALNELQDINVLLIAVNTLLEGAQIAVLGHALINKVICIPKEDEKTAFEIISAIGT